MYHPLSSTDFVAIMRFLPSFYVVTSLLLLTVGLPPSDAFAFVARQSPCLSSAGTTNSIPSLSSYRYAPCSALQASPSNDDCATAEDRLSRRDAGSSIIAMMASAFATTFTNTDAFAESGPEAEGRLVEFEVANLDGGGSGKFVIKMRPDWAPKGVERFESLTENGFWDGCRIFRVIPGFIAQFGISGSPEVQSVWRSKVR